MTALDAEIDMTNLTIMGHGFGATTAASVAAKDERFKKIITFDAWLSPLKEQISDKSI